MKSTKIAVQYEIPLYTLDAYLKKQKKVPIRETMLGDIIIPDDTDLPALLAPLLEEEKLKKADYAKWQQDKKDREEQARIDEVNRERAAREEQFRRRIQNLKDNSYEGYYEYKAISLADIGGLFRAQSGRVNIEAMTQILNDMGLDGWHLVTAYSNEMGKNAFSGGAGGVVTGINSTVDENILIFERFVRFR